MVSLRIYGKALTREMERRICRTSSPILSDGFEREHRSEKKYQLSLLLLSLILIKFNFDNKIKCLKDSTLSFPYFLDTIRLALK